MSRGAAFEAADRAAEALTPAGDLLPFVVAGILVLAAGLLLLLGGRVHRDTEERLRRIDGMIARGEVEGEPDV